MSPQNVGHREQKQSEQSSHSHSAPEINPLASSINVSSLFQSTSHVSDSLSPGIVLQLQRTVGNQAVQRLVQRAPDAGAPTAPKNTVPVPGLGPARTEVIEKFIQAGDFEKALTSLVVFKYADGTINPQLLKDNKMTYDPELKVVDGSSGTPSWNYDTNKAEPAKVTIGPGAFSSVAYLYSVVMHEYQHVLHRQSIENQFHDKKNREQGFTSADEVEAAAWELLHAAESGLERVPDKTAQIWSNLNDEFAGLEAGDKTRLKPLVQRAFQQAQRIVKGTKVTLAPFKSP